MLPALFGEESCVTTGITALQSICFRAFQSFFPYRPSIGGDECACRLTHGCKWKNCFLIHSGLWGLVNNAGIGFSAPIEWTPLEKSKHIADINMWGMIDVTKTFLPLVKKARGRVVNISSVVGRVSPPNTSSYCVTKYGVQAFSDALRREMAPWGVQVSIIEPGLFKTALANEERQIQVLQEFWDGLSLELKEEYGERKLNQVKQGVSKSCRMASSETSKVVNAIIDALTSQRPQTRYSVDLDGKLFIFISFLPTFIADFFFRNV
ncbi:retinol dehydrogenase 7-like [Orbicella faveolata]|uniref:retinol dehydrogenase 7-like n=1 Tax=Orbicella faveolata TaxID=48498 RepID=UPI0009E5AFE6|nr:retinol dehydrogenase 7-like [Orbicella faveolata]XP_020611175.1 retinol dehydrogenase 7-like [Orbicella faveolata]